MKAKAVAAGMEAREQEAGGSEKAQLQIGDTPGLEEIRHRAYELHLERGSTHGCDLDDWLQAERELKEKQQSTST